LTLLIIGFWLVLSVALSFRAEIRGRSFGGWLILSLLISPLAAGILLFVLPPIIKHKAPPPKDPRWHNLRALQPDMAVAAAALQAAQEANKQGALGARRRHQDRQAIIGALIAVGLILFLFLTFALTANADDEPPPRPPSGYLTCSIAQYCMKQNGEWTPPPSGLRPTPAPPDSRPPSAGPPLPRPFERQLDLAIGDE
jgi:hypothetical protein